MATVDPSNVLLGAAKEMVPPSKESLVTPPVTNPVPKQYHVYVLEGAKDTSKAIVHLQKDGAKWIGSQIVPVMDEQGKRFGSQVVLLYMNTHAITVTE